MEVMAMVFRDDSGHGERPGIDEFDGLPELVDDVETALEEAERSGEDIKWLKVRPPVIAVDFPRNTPLNEIVEFFDDYLIDAIPEDEFNAKLLDFKIFGRAIEIYPRDYAYEEKEMASMTDENGGDGDGV